jgi:transcriptional regulator with XRE-family HTH domain
VCDLDALHKIQEILKAQSLKQKDLTDFLGLGKASFSDWKSGKSSYEKHLPRIADFLGVSVDYLLGRTDEPRVEKPSTAPPDPLGSLTPENHAKALEYIALLLGSQENLQ